MNPKKQIYEFIKNAHKRQTEEHDPAEKEKWQELFDGMSTGTARIIIDREAGENLPGGYEADLQNKGRYYVAKIIGTRDNIIQRLLVDKQTGEVRFI